MLPILICVGVAGALWAVVSVLSPDKSDRVNDRLDEIRDPTRREKKLDGESQGTGVKAAFQKAAPALSKALDSGSELERDKLRLRLANAGFNSPNAPQLYLAIKVALLITGLVLGTVGGLVTWGATQNGFVTIFIAGGVGFYLAEIGLWWLSSSRIEKIFLSLPDALDLLVVCVEAGLGLDQGMRKVSEELADTSPAVCEEFAIANKQLQLGRTRSDVLRDMGIRSGVDDMRSLAAILIQADKFGSSIAKALRVQSDAMRVRRSQLAEERAQKTAVKMIFPLVLFIFPGIFVVLVGPAAVMMINGLLKE